MSRRLLVLDVDSTLVTDEQIDLLAAHAGTHEQVAAITEAAMRGELDFADSLRARVAALAGLDAAACTWVREQLRFTPGATELLMQCAARGWPVGLVSGGFREIVDPLVADLPITRIQANRLEVVDAVLTGRTIGPIVDRAAKADFLRDFAAEQQVRMADTIAVGDGANDLDMVAAAGLGVAFMAKPALRAQADLILNGPRLDELLTHLGDRPLSD
ncbi:MAG: phosphoserine phosphatase SerB [Beutenbergiaceae bacterium]